MELNDKLEQHGKPAEKNKPDRFQCPECGKRCETIIRDVDSKILSRFICEECYAKERDDTTEIHKKGRSGA